MADLGNEPVTSDDEGAKVCQNPMRGDKIEAGKQRNKYFPWRKVLMLKLTSHSKNHISTSWEVKVDGLL